MTPRLKLAMEQDGPSRGRYVRDIIRQADLTVDQFLDKL